LIEGLLLHEERFVLVWGKVSSCTCMRKGFFLFLRKGFLLYEEMFLLIFEEKFPFVLGNVSFFTRNCVPRRLYFPALQ
jgi:hypothetical protein